MRGAARRWSRGAEAGRCAACARIGAPPRCGAGAGRLSTGCEQICAQPHRGRCGAPTRRLGGGAAIIATVGSGSAAHRLRRRPAFASHVDFLRLGLRSAGFAGRPASAVKVENAGNSAFDGVIVFNFLMQIINNLNAKARFHGPGRQGWNSGGRRFSRRGEPSRGDQEVASEQQKPLFFKGLSNLKRFGERRRAHRGYAAIPLAAW